MDGRQKIAWNFASLLLEKEDIDIDIDSSPISLWCTTILFPPSKK
jgi:hypothetical protein